ncbi:MAG: hypothetical protein H7061_01610 [Bdellovibrionaceae bacterium]|nr:hypothetical protein [Bdellovibrio sp.]
MIQHIDSDDEQKTNDQSETTSKKKASKVKIKFPFSDLLRAQVPKAFAVAEKVATDWKNEGNFTELGLKSPLADAVATQALQKAKEVEKKLEEKGVFTLAKMGVEMAKSQLEQFKKKK